MSSEANTSKYSALAPNGPDTMTNGGPGELMALDGRIAESINGLGRFLSDDPYRSPSPSPGPVPINAEVPPGDDGGGPDSGRLAVNEIDGEFGGIIDQPVNDDIGAMDASLDRGLERLLQERAADEPAVAASGRQLGS
ncbi:hypothetical protein [Thiohalorhabdus sp.]|uniref:hypothetical protein n=1 Tax=Thiohalorhabdus sp. TaxID=3094134 RepID=UPI002FC38CF7